MVFRLVGYLHVQVLTYIGVYSTGNVVLKNGKKLENRKFPKFLNFLAGFLKFCLRQGFPKKNWPGSVLGRKLFLFFSVRLSMKFVWTII